MVRALVSSLAAAAMLLLFQSGARAQQAPAQRIALNQSLLDRWLVVMPAVINLGKSDAAPQSDDEARPHMERICADAGFPSYETCAEVIGYVGMIVSACDRRSQSFAIRYRLMRRELARLEADTKMPPEAKAQAIADVKEIVAVVSQGLPPRAHRFDERQPRSCLRGLDRNDKIVRGNMAPFVLLCDFRAQPAMGSAQRSEQDERGERRCRGYGPSSRSSRLRVRCCATRSRRN